MSNLHQRLSKYVLCDEDSIVVDLKNSHGSWLVDNTGKIKNEIIGLY